MKSLRSEVNVTEPPESSCEHQTPHSYVPANITCLLWKRGKLSVIWIFSVLVGTYVSNRST